MDNHWGARTRDSSKAYWNVCMNWPISLDKTYYFNYNILLLWKFQCQMLRNHWYTKHCAISSMSDSMDSYILESFKIWQEFSSSDQGWGGWRELILEWKYLILKSERICTLLNVVKTSCSTRSHGGETLSISWKG